MSVPLVQGASDAPAEDPREVEFKRIFGFKPGQYTIAAHKMVAFHVNEINGAYKRAKTTLADLQKQSENEKSYDKLIELHIREVDAMRLVAEWEKQLLAMVDLADLFKFSEAVNESDYERPQQLRGLHGVAT